MLVSWSRKCRREETSIIVAIFAPSTAGRTDSQALNAVVERLIGTHSKADSRPSHWFASWFESGGGEGGALVARANARVLRACQHLLCSVQVRQSLSQGSS